MLPLVQHPRTVNRIGPLTFSLIVRNHLPAGEAGWPCYGQLMLRNSTLFAIVTPALLLSACGSDNGYPSLARRDAERINDSEAPAAPSLPAQAPADAKLTARLASLVEQGRTAHGRFLSRRGDSERAIAAASGSAVGSESWAVATVALAGLESARSEVLLAMGDLDQIFADEAIKATETNQTANRDAAKTARDQVDGWVLEENQAIERLQARLRR